MDRLKRYLLGITFGLVIYLGLILFYIHPHRPADLTGWALLVFGGAPFYMAMEMAGESIFNEKQGRKISGKDFSSLRILCAVLFVVLFYAALWLAWGCVAPFIRPHFA